ncbi:MAG: D-aminoacyl-tRNA deacylase [Thermodesulfobacteriota bacterium]
MRIVLQRVRRAEVRVEQCVEAQIGVGIVLFVGLGRQEGDGLMQNRAWWAVCDKIWGLRIFPDQRGRFDQDVRQYGGEVLAVPQFTLYGNCRRGRRPAFDDAAPPEVARSGFATFCTLMEQRGQGQVQRGVFGAEMDVDLVNWGPVTFWLDSADFL